MATARTQEIKAKNTKEPEAVPKPEAPAAEPTKGAAEVAKTGITSSIRNQPSDEELAARKAESKPANEKHVKAQTASGGDMWDPDAGQWIYGRPTLAVDTDWLKRQTKAKKIKILE